MYYENFWKHHLLYFCNIWFLGLLCPLLLLLCVECHTGCRRAKGPFLHVPTQKISCLVSLYISKLPEQNNNCTSGLWKHITFLPEKCLNNASILFHNDFAIPLHFMHSCGFYIFNSYIYSILFYFNTNIISFIFHHLPNNSY